MADFLDLSPNHEEGRRKQEEFRKRSFPWETLSVKKFFRELRRIRKVDFRNLHQFMRKAFLHWMTCIFNEQVAFDLFKKYVFVIFQYFFFFLTLHFLIFCFHALSNSCRTTFKLLLETVTADPKRLHTHLLMKSAIRSSETSTRRSVSRNLGKNLFDCKRKFHDILSWNLWSHICAKIIALFKFWFCGFKQFSHLKWTKLQQKFYAILWKILKSANWLSSHLHCSCITNLTPFQTYPSEKDQKS